MQSTLTLGGGLHGRSAKTTTTTTTTTTGASTLRTGRQSTIQSTQEHDTGPGSGPFATSSGKTTLLLETAQNLKANSKAPVWTARSRTWQAMTLAAFVTAAWTFYFIFASPRGYSEYPLSKLQARILGNALGRAHVWGGGTAMALGPFQFLASLRRRPTSKVSASVSASHNNNNKTITTTILRNNSIHSWLGRLYNVCVISAGIGSLDIVRKSDLYDWGTLGFVVLGSLWAVTATLGWVAMVNGATPDIPAHKKWMTRNFSLTYAAVMLRWQLPILLQCGLTLKLALSISGWLCWVPNIIFVDLI